MSALTPFVSSPFGRVWNSASFNAITFISTLVLLSKVPRSEQSHVVDTSYLASPTHADDYYYGGATKRIDASHPWTWPYLSRGLNCYGSKETNNYVYLMGNPLLWCVDHSLHVHDALPPKSGQTFQGQAQPRDQGRA
jgi:hypothetical protein